MSGLRRQLDQAQNELREARQETTEARNNNRMTSNELEEHRCETRLQAREADAEIRKLRLEKSDLETKLREQNQHSLAQEEESRTSVETMRLKAEDAVRKVGVLVQTEKRDRIKAQNELRSLKKELQSLQTRAEGQSDPVSRHQTAQSTIADDRRKLESILQATQTASAKADAARLENQILRDDYEIISRAMDEKVFQMVKEREKRWSEKVEALMKDNATLKRALMHEWGREECGLGVPQSYRYKYLQR
jgi:chromosome segregation ATPase